MQAELTRQFPDTLNRVEVRTIKRQKVESIRVQEPRRIARRKGVGTGDRRSKPHDLFTEGQKGLGTTFPALDAIYARVRLSR